MEDPEEVRPTHLAKPSQGRAGWVFKDHEDAEDEVVSEVDCLSQKWHVVVVTCATSKPHAHRNNQEDQLKLKQVKESK